MSEGKSWVDKAVQLTSSKKRGSLYHQEAIEEPIISFQKAGDRPPMVSGVSNSSYSFDSPINYRVSYAANGRSTRKARTTSAILSPFKKKTCINFFENEEKLGFCKCGRPKSDHSKDAINNANAQWNIKKHIKSCKTNAYGEVEFHGTNRKTRAKYIRVSDETDAKDALKLLLREWKLEYPNFLVSVTGGAKTFKLPVKLKHLFSNGLYKVAQTSGAWVITGGTNTGVMKHVGEALQIASNTQYGTQGDSNRRVYCIGIATWGIVENRNLLTNANSTVKYYMKNSIEAAGACLDNNHTHFFLVDNGTVNQYGKEIQFRAQLEKQIMKMEVDKNRGKVPAVLLVLEGGPNTVATVYEAITNDPAVPVIVIKDSGRAADLLAYAHNISHGEGTFYYMGDVVEHKQLFKRIEQTYPELNQEGCLKVYGNVLKCVERKHLITIFKMEEGTADLDQAILKALLKSKSASPEEQLKLALLWNRPDVARAQIFNEELKWPLSSLESAMKVALAKDRTEFVELLLEHGVSMGNFLTRDRLDSLYSTRARERKSMLRYMLDKAKIGAVTLRDAESLFYTLTGLSLNPQQQQTHRTVPQAMAHIVPLNSRDALTQSFRHPFNQLFVWAVLNNMQKMALCFWKHGEEPMAKALVACKLYFALAKYADKRDMKDDIMETLTTNGEEFQRLAVQLLDHCFITDESRSSKLMTYELRNWGNTTNLNLAVTSGHTLFVAHSCNQELLTDIWSGVMTLRTLKSLKTVLCMFCPPLVLCLSFRTKREVLKMPQTEGMLDEFSFRDEEDAPVTNVDIKEELEEEKGDVNLRRNETFSSSFDDSNFSILAASQRDAETVMSAEMVKTQSLSYLEKYRGFYTAPITKFWGNVLAYLVFLGLFTYVLLGKLEKNLSNTELVVIVFVISMTTEEIRQVLKSDTGRFYKKVYEWSRSKWNLCDGLAIFLFYIGLALRLNPPTVSAGRVVLAIDIMFWIIRLLDIFSVNQNLGPYVVIIGKMTIDLAYFLFIMAVFLLAYGVARQTILEPNKPVSWKSVAEIFFVPYFQVYGELFIDKEHLYSNNLTYFGTTKHNDYSEPAVSLLMAFYLLIANILLLNLLIAIFNNTFSKVQVNSNQIWKFQRYHLILEYARRPPLVPPFVFLNHVFSVLKWAYNRCRRSECCGGHQKESSFETDRKIKIYPSSAELDDLMQFEENCLADFLHKRNNAFLSSKEEKDRLVLEKIDNISWRLEEFKRETWTREERIDTKMLKVQHRLEEFSKSLSETLTVLNGKQGGMVDKLRSNSIPASGVKHVAMTSSAPAATVIGLGRTPPTMRRFLSQNPYMHNPAYDRTSSVKEAAWNFRKSSLTSPLKAKLIQAYYKNDVDNVGEDCVDGLPPQPQLVDQEGSSTKEAVQETDEIVAEDTNDQKAAPDEFDSVDGNDVICTGSHSQPHPLSHLQPLSQPQPQLQTKARTSPYPASGVARFPVPDFFVHWEVDFPEYSPPDYTSSMLKLSTSIDKDDKSDINFNTLDNGVDRESFFGLYEVIDGRPRNPFGRTGLTGRGLLGRWGPNHATEAIVTRWKRGPKGEMFTRGKSSLEFLGLKRNDLVIFPGEISKTSAKIPEIILKALATRKQSADQLPRGIFSDTTEISIYFDDTRNTDNSWLETKVINYHFEFEMNTDFKLENSNLFWIELDSEVSVTAEHNECLAKVAEKRGANF